MMPKPQAWASVGDQFALHPGIVLIAGPTSTSIASACKIRSTALLLASSISDLNELPIHLAFRHSGGYFVL